MVSATIEMPSTITLNASSHKCFFSHKANPNANFFQAIIYTLQFVVIGVCAYLVCVVYRSSKNECFNEILELLSETLDTLVTKHAAFEAMVLAISVSIIFLDLSKRIQNKEMQKYLQQ